MGIGAESPFADYVRALRNARHGPHSPVLGHVERIGSCRGRRLSLLLALLLVASSCATGGANERTVLVDFEHDEFSSFFASNFPKQVTVAAGDTVVFKQNWTGEPHTVTGGRSVDKVMAKGKHFITFFNSYSALRANGVPLPNPEAENPEGTVAEMLSIVEGLKNEPLGTEVIEAYDALVKQGVTLPPRNNPGDTTFADLVKVVDKEATPLFESLPYAFPEDFDSGIAQNVGQACYLGKGLPPKDPKKHCSKSRQVQPVFDGQTSFYNSGIIPYEGPQGNTFRVKLASNLKPGSYFFYCAVHGPGQSSEVRVRPKGSKIPSQEQVSREARAEIAALAKPLLKLYRDAKDGEFEKDSEVLRGPFAGLGLDDIHASINELTPKTIRTKVGEKVTWKIIGADHTISFNVPKYFPIIRFAKDGTISINPRIERPQGGSPPIPKQEEGDGPTKLDGGTFDGKGFYSSGLLGGEYSLTFSKPGTYAYACLLHPPMVGTVVVSR